MTESRTHSGPALADILADCNRRRVATHDRIRIAATDAARMEAALHYIADHDADMVQQALDDQECPHA